MDYIYLASPYSAPTKRERRRRYNKVVREAGRLMAMGHTVFCPIAHSHDIGMSLKKTVDHEFWMKQDLPMLSHSIGLWVYKMKGWEWSRGVAEEISFAIENNIPIKYLEAT